jgi:hypothetical protein
LLCFGDYSVVVGNSNLGLFKYFGKKDRWHRVLASPEREVKPNFVEVFKYFAKNEILNWEEFIETLVSESINIYNGKWLWYCLNNKYKTILDHPVYTKNTKERVEIFYNQSLNSYHHNPFVFWFRFHSPLEIRKFINEQMSGAQYSSFSKLQLINGAKLMQIGNRWVILNLEENIQVDYFKFNEEKSNYYIECSNLIDDLIPFIEKINSLTVQLDENSI